MLGHKTANVLNKVALSVQANMKTDLREIYGAPTRAAAAAAIDVFADKYGVKYEKAVACLTKDQEALLAFFDFPAEHWDHLRTSNPIESVFATVRHRTVRTKGALSAKDRQTHGVQTGRRRRENMAAIEGRKPVAKGHRRRQIPKRNRGRQNAGSPRRLTASSPNLLHSSIGRYLHVHAPTNPQPNGDIVIEQHARDRNIFDVTGAA